MKQGIIEEAFYRRFVYWGTTRRDDEEEEGEVQGLSLAGGGNLNFTDGTQIETAGEVD